MVEVLQTEEEIAEVEKEMKKVIVNISALSIVNDQGQQVIYEEGDEIELSVRDIRLLPQKAIIIPETTATIQDKLLKKREKRKGKGKKGKVSKIPKLPTFRKPPSSQG